MFNQARTYSQTPSFAGSTYAKKGIAQKMTVNYDSFGAPLLERTFGPEICSTYTEITDTADIDVINDAFGTSYTPATTLVYDKWYRSSSAAASVASGSLRFKKNGVNIISVGKGFVATAGKSYSLSFKRWKQGTSNNTIQVFVYKVSTNADVYNLASLTLPVGAGSAATYTLNNFFTPTDNGNYVFGFRIDGSDTSTVYIDDVVFTYEQPVYTTFTDCHNDPEKGYRFGFNGQEKDDEIYGEANAYTAEFWEYDPRIGRRWDIDPKPIASESEYACFRNSPILHSDPKGDFPWPPFWLWKQASEGLKYISPITFSPNVTFGTHDIGIGGTYSVGFPKLLPISYRYEFGATYYFKENFTQSKGWETSTSHNFSVGLGLTKFNWMRTDYSNNWGTSQGVGTAGFSNPLFSLSTTNDIAELGGDGGDRFKYGASLHIQAGAFSAGGKIGTGDPGFGPVKRSSPQIGGGDFRNGTYVPVVGQDGKIFNPNQYRMGIAYFGFMGLKIGIDSEQYVRAPVQNQGVHDKPWVNSPYFQKLNIPDKLFLQYNTE